eukprot:356690-Chlamydomonas_euryale.AAC.19
MSTRRLPSNPYCLAQDTILQPAASNNQQPAVGQRAKVCTATWDGVLGIVFRVPDLRAPSGITQQHRCARPHALQDDSHCPARWSRCPARQHGPTPCHAVERGRQRLFLGSTLCRRSSTIT